MSYVLAVTGAREGRPDTASQLTDVVSTYGTPRLIVLGGDMNRGVKSQRGVDKQAFLWAQTLPRKPQIIIEYADWDAGYGEGPDRNLRMAQHCGPGDVCLVLPGPKSRGTWDCHRRMEARHMTCIVRELV